MPENVGCTERLTGSARHDPSASRVVVSIADHGIGISPEDQKKLFSTFSRIRRPETENISGTGLGLYVVKGMVENMNGEVWLESVIKEGTTFFFTLPTSNEVGT